MVKNLILIVIAWGGVSYVNSSLAQTHSTPEFLNNTIDENDTVPFATRSNYFRIQAMIKLTF
jgi:hypothetical protein